MPTCTPELLPERLPELLPERLPKRHLPLAIASTLAASIELPGT